MASRVRKIDVTRAKKKVTFFMSNAQTTSHKQIKYRLGAAGLPTFMFIFLHRLYVEIL